MLRAALRCAAGASVRSRSCPPRRDARRAIASAARRLALRYGMTIRDPGRSHPHAFGGSSPTADRRRSASCVKHARVAQNEPDCSDGTESRALTSPQSTAKRIFGQVGDSCLQHATLRFGLFSFSCPRFRYVRPTEAIVRPTAPRDRAHGPYRYARSAPCVAPQGPAGICKTAGRDRAPSGSVNVSKLKHPPARRWPAMRAVERQRPADAGAEPGLTLCGVAPRIA